MIEAPMSVPAGTLSYREAGALLRLAVSRATRARLNGSEWRVLTAVLSLTVSYSKSHDRTYVAQIAEMADLDRRDSTLKRTKRALKKLDELGIISYQPARRDGERTLIGLPVRDLLREEIAA